MRFIIKRASTSCSNEESPIPSDSRIKKESLSYHLETDISLFATERRKKEWLNLFYLDGKDHSNKGTVYTKTYRDDQWVIELCTLHALLQLIKEQGSVIVDTVDNYDDIEFDITIYDDYVE